MSLKMSSVSTFSNGGAYPAGLPGGGGPRAAQKGGWGCRKSTEGQKVLLGWSRECAEGPLGISLVHRLGPLWVFVSFFVV